MKLTENCQENQKVISMLKEEVENKTWNTCLSPFHQNYNLPFCKIDSLSNDTPNETSNFGNNQNNPQTLGESKKIK